MSKKKKEKKKDVKRTPKSSNRKKSIQKRKRTGTKSNSKRGKGKKVQCPSVRRSRKSTKRKTKVKIDNRFWNDRKKRKRSTTRSLYITRKLKTGRKSTYFPDIGTEFEIKKKVASIKPEKPSESLTVRMGKKASRYLKVSDDPIEPKAVYIKVVLKDYITGESRWVSAPRQDVESSDNVESIYRSILDDAEGYGKDFDVIGTEIEEVIN